MKKMQFERPQSWQRFLLLCVLVVCGLALSLARAQDPDPFGHGPCDDGPEPLNSYWCSTSYMWWANNGCSTCVDCGRDWDEYTPPDTCPTSPGAGGTKG